MLISDLAAICLPAGAMVFVFARRLFHPRYRRAVLFLISGLLSLESLSLLGVFQQAEASDAWRVKQEGITTKAYIISSRRMGKTSRANIHGSEMFEVSCDYIDSRGEKLRGRILLPDEVPHTRGSSVSVRYLPSRPALVREEYYVASAKDPRNEARAGLPWIADTLLFVAIYGDAGRRKKRAVATGRFNFPY